VCITAPHEVKTSALVSKLRKYLPTGFQTRLAEGELKGKASRTLINMCCRDLRQNDLVDQAIISMAKKEKERQKKLQAEKAKRVAAIID